jgi:hypothetical protein
MSSTVEFNPTKCYAEGWAIELDGDNKVKLTDSSEKTKIFEFEAVLFMDKGATYHFKNYCAFQGKAPSDVLKRIKDVRFISSGDGLPEVLTLATAKFRKTN